MVTVPVSSDVAITTPTKSVVNCELLPVSYQVPRKVVCDQQFLFTTPIMLLFDCRCKTTSPTLVLPLYFCPDPGIRPGHHSSSIQPVNLAHRGPTETSGSSTTQGGPANRWVSLSYRIIFFGATSHNIQH